MSSLPVLDEQQHGSPTAWVCEDLGLAYHLASLLPVREMCSLRAANSTHKEGTQQLLVQRLASHTLHGSAVDRRKALFAVGEVADARDSDLRQALDVCLNHCVLSVRWAAASVLLKHRVAFKQGMVSDMTLSAVLSEDASACTEAVATKIVPRLHNADPAVRCASLFLLRRLMKTGDCDLIRAAVRLLSDASHQVRTCAAKVLSEVVDTCDDSIKIPLVYLLQDPEGGVQKASALALADISKHGDFECLPEPLQTRPVLKRSTSRHACAEKHVKRRRGC
eukprot:TRINITY_DN61560_c0_g1_i1.p1 TRINITY_DN61560_c0_g1~~TRINITY_DN61560_c0_g1_i1.p1  ORF type:complete len:300 (+),score=61.30 TRINITY_DN61560_c0_g1_i1:64-900(+)